MTQHTLRTLTLTLVASLATLVFACMFALTSGAAVTSVAGQAVPASHVDVCELAAQSIYDTQDYTGSATEQACFGEEDDPRVGLALDYGQTVAGYALSEASEA
jgi:hypothetical protein